MRKQLAESLKTLRCLLNRAVREDAISTTPPFDVPRRIRKMPIAYSEQEQAALLAAAQELGPRYTAVILLGIDGGPRLAELLGLQWSDIDFGQASMVLGHNIVRGKLDVPKGKTEDETHLRHKDLHTRDSHIRTWHQHPRVPEDSRC